MRLKKGLTGVVKRVSLNKIFLLRFQYGCEKYLDLNQINSVTVYKTPLYEEPKVPTIDVIPDEIIDL